MSPRSEPLPPAPAAETEKAAAGPELGVGAPPPSQDGGRVIIRGRSHMPSDSVLFERIIPILLLGFGLVAATLVLIAAGVLLGVVPFR